MNLPPLFSVFHAERWQSKIHFIAQASDGTFYMATSDQSQAQVLSFSSSSIATHFLIPLATTELKKHFVDFDPDKMHQLDGVPSPADYVKRQYLFEHLDWCLESGDTDSFAYKALAAELSVVGELQKAGPHPNICLFRGVLVDPILGVTDIVYKRYDMDLMTFWTRPKNRTAANKAIIIKGVKAGMEHLHGLKIAHMDLRPENIFISCEDDYDAVKRGQEVQEVVIGDFDAALKFGAVDWLKNAGDDWWDSGMWDKCIAEGNGVDGRFDIHALEVLDEWLEC